MSLALRLTGVAIAASFAVAAMSGVSAPPYLERPSDIADASPLAISRLPVSDPTSGRSLIERSPFAQSRAEFSRNAGPPAPELEVRLTGISKVGGEMRASLVVGGHSMAVRQGDETPAGIVASIEASAVVLEGANPRRIEMFKSYDLRPDFPP